MIIGWILGLLLCVRAAFPAPGVEAAGIAAPLPDTAAPRARKNYTITVTAERGGRIVPVSSARPREVVAQPGPEDCARRLRGAERIRAGGARYFAVVPARGWDVAMILVDGKPWRPEPTLLGLNQYLWTICPFTDVSANHVLRVVFRKN